MFLETTFFPTEQQQKFIDLVLSNDFLWTILDEPVEGYPVKHVSMMHIISARRKDLSENPGTIDSEYYYQAKDIFDTICENNNIEPKIIYRMCFNTTVHYSNQHSGIHKDHMFEHKNFILYLNDFSNGSTFLFDESKNLTKEIKSQKNKVVFFDGYHAQGFCKENERRVVLVVTFGD